MTLDDIDIRHHIAGGAVIKETRIAAGTNLLQHAHRYPHLSYLVSGVVELTREGCTSLHVGPACLVIEAEKLHAVGAVTDAIWLCIHAEADAEAVDRNQVLPRSEAEMQAVLARA